MLPSAINFPVSLFKFISCGLVVVLQITVWLIEANYQRKIQVVV